MRALAAIVLASCTSSPPPVESCRDSLHGVWHSPAGAWMLLDRGDSLDGYPLFDDSRAPAEPGVEVAPRSLALVREGPELGGESHRRYMLRGDACTASVPLHVLRCSGDVLEIVIADTSAPLTFSPCEWSQRKLPTAREKWTRVR